MTIIGAIRSTLEAHVAGLSAIYEQALRGPGRSRSRRRNGRRSEATPLKFIP